MERDSGFNFFSQLPSVLGSSAASFNIYSQVSSSSAAHAPRAGLDGLDLNFNLQGAEEFPHIGEYENYLQSGGDQGEVPRGALVSLPFAHSAHWEYATCGW